MRLTFAFAPRDDDGEDAAPLNDIVSPESALLAVFDGMGGAGSAKYEMPNGDSRSGAWIASRFVRDVTLRFFQSLHDSPSLATDDSPELSLDEPASVVAALEQVLKLGLHEKVAVLGNGPGSGRLKGTMGRTLPTTIAGAWVDSRQQRVEIFWAGDSRVFLLTPSVGVQQLTTDDLVTGADAMKNLTDDSPLSNHVCADRDFVINHHSVELTGPAMVFAATDGCFGYSRTPAHFERLLLRSLARSSSPDTWSQGICSDISRITGDDATFSAVVCGWATFGEFQRAMKKRLSMVESLLAADDKVQQKYRDLQSAVENTRGDAERVRQHVWDGYREDYERLLLEKDAQ